MIHYDNSKSLLMKTKGIKMTLVAIIATLSLMSCSESSDSLSGSTAKSLVKKELQRLEKLQVAEEIPVGYFECNDNSRRFRYRQLAANELITYKCEKVKKMERVQKTRYVTRRGFFNYTYREKQRYYVDEEVTTYFVTIALTEKGEKLVYEAPEVKPSDDEKEMKLDLEVDESKFPESKVSADEFAEQKPSTTPTVESNEALDTVVVDSTDVIEDQPLPKASSKSKKAKSAYEEAKDNEKYDVVLLKAYKLDIVKARNILKTGDYSAEAEIIFEYENVTPVGRIFSKVKEGGRFKIDNVKYIYYQDKGWQVNVE